MSDEPMTEEEAAEAEAAESEAAATGGVNPLYILFGVLAGIVAVALLWFLVVSPLLGDDAQEPDQSAQPTPSPAVTGTPAPGATPGQQPPQVDEEVDVPLETFEVFLARDPFRPIRPDAVPPADAGGGPPPIPGDGTTTPPGDGSTPPPTDSDGDGVPDNGGQLPDTDGDGRPDDGNGDGDGDGDQPPKEDRATVEGHEVELIDVVIEDGRRRVVVRVDDTSYTVEAGETFADRFRLLSIDGSCATFLYGDNRFTLCEGERVLK